MLRDKTERYIIERMGEIAKAYYEPYDSEDTKNAKQNEILTIEYNLYKKLLKELYNF